MNRFVIAEPKKCIGCRTCEVACVLAHSNGEGVATLSQATFAPRLKVIKGLSISTPVLCRHCEDAPCANVCPTGAIVYSQNSVQVQQDRCVGCKTCMVACPFGAMEIVTKMVQKPLASGLMASSMKAEAHKCDLCAGREAGPACIPVCPTKALHVVDRNAMELALQKRRERAALDSGADVLL